MYSADPMRLLISAVINERYGDRIGSVDPSIEPVVMGADGIIRDRDGTPVDPDLPIDAAWGSADVFTEMAFMAFVRSASSLRWFHSAAAGLDHPLFAEMMSRGTRLTTTHVQSIAIAEYVLRSVLDHFHDAPEWWAGHELRSWDRRSFREVYNTTWLIIGLGAIGTDVARRASPFGVRLIGMRRHPTGAEPVDEMVAPGDLDAVGRADVIVLAAPATAETHHLVDERLLSATKPGALLVNVARGSLVDEAALVAALDRGQLGGAVLDVTEREPLPPDDPLWVHPRIVVTPHTSAHGDGMLARAVEAFTANLARYVAGEPLEHEIAVEGRRAASRDAAKKDQR
jgi:phosphoglycerate dehydrogenase-like enzyme